MEVRRLAPCEALVALLGAMLVLGGALGFFWLAPFETEMVFSNPNPSIGDIFLLMLFSLALVGMGLDVYWTASEIQARRLDREEG